MGIFVREAFLMALGLHLVVNLTRVEAKSPYCAAKYKCGSEQHTMCKYQDDSGFGKNCALPNETGITGGQKYDLLYKLNLFRRSAAFGEYAPLPSAMSMPKLYWDDQLAEIAQRWAIQCNDFDSHDTCRKTDNDAEVTQNILEYDVKSGSTFLHEMDLWFNFRYFPIYNFNNSGDIKYDDERYIANILYDGVNRVGCGHVRYLKRKAPSALNRTGLLVCNFGSATAMTGPLYKSGLPCSSCEELQECADGALCGIGEEEGEIVLDTASGSVVFAILLIAGVFVACM